MIDQRHADFAGRHLYGGCAQLGAYGLPGVQQWWETRRHWHTEEFDHVVAEIIAKGNKPKAFSTYNLRDLSETGT